MSKIKIALLGLGTTALSFWLMTLTNSDVLRFIFASIGCVIVPVTIIKLAK